MTRRLFLALALATLVIHAPQAQSSWRPTVMGTQGMVAAGHPLAAEVGLRVLKAGGNAVDAAVAAWAIQGQVEPGMTGLGADMFALIYLAKTKEVKFINGTGYAPKAATIDYYNAHGGMPDDGGLSIAVPGAVGGAALALEKYGTKSLAEVLAPAIEVAEKGYPITENLARGLDGGQAKLGKFPSTTKIWFRDGAPLADGRRRDQSRPGKDAPRHRDAGPGRLLHRAGRHRARRRHAGARRDHQRGGSGQLQGIRGRADPRQLPRLRGLRVPAEFAGAHHAAGPEPPRGLQPALHGPQQRAVPARGHRVDQAGLRRPQPVRGRPGLHSEHPDARAAVEGVRDQAPGAHRPEPRHRRRSPVRRPAGRRDHHGRPPGGLRRAAARARRGRLPTTPTRC